jgi:hypothetical protein
MEIAGVGNGVNVWLLLVQEGTWSNLLTLVRRIYGAKWLIFDCGLGCFLRSAVGRKTLILEKNGGGGGGIGGGGGG